MTLRPPFFLVTLLEEPWKEQAALEHLITHSIVPVVVHGFHGMLLGLRPACPFQFNSNGEPEYIHVAQVGCAVSHLVALQVAVASGASEFIICEDDVQLVDGFADAWRQVRAVLPNEVGVLQLEYIPVQSRNTDGSLQPAACTPVSPGVSRIAGYAHCAACSFWRRDAAIKALQLARPIDGPWDIMLMRKVYPHLVHAICTPPLAGQLTATGRWQSSIGVHAGKVLDKASRENK